jgi:hypothetical protein
VFLIFGPGALIAFLATTWLPLGFVGPVVMAAWLLYAWRRKAAETAVLATEARR